MSDKGLRRFMGCAVLLWSAACSTGKEAAPPSGPPPNAKIVDVSKAANVSGRVTIDGTVPANPPMQMSADPYCSAQNPKGATFENFVVNDGGLENVFVYVSDKLDYYFEVPTTPVKLDQKNCHYLPHVLGVRAGQTLAIGNSDDTPHNVHAVPNANRAWNKGQALKNMVDEKVFTARDVMIPFKCDVHNWMRAYVGVMDHPYYAVTQGGGKFELKNLPAGTYTVAAWHEKLGTQTQSVTVVEKDSKEISFTFRAPAAATD
jgi:plastocyanin